MKTYIIYIILPLCFFSCEDITGFLEKPPGVDVTEETVFSSKEEVEKFVAGAYYYGILSDMFGWWDDRDKNDVEISAACDEAETYASWFWCQSIWNSAGMSAIDGRGDNRFNTHWVALRRANILIEKIEDAPFDAPDYKKQVLGEALFIRAFNHFELFKKYGGIPLIKIRFNPSDDLKVPRNTVKETVDFIVEDCNRAIELLPHDYPSAMKGRLTRSAAMALKSRTLLYAAGETFNTATPYLDLGENNELICYGNRDKERWKLAADAAKQWIDEYPSGGFKLITDKGADINYRYVWETNDNDEIILAEKSKPERYQWDFPYNFRFPPFGLFITWNFMRLYETKAGADQPWKMEGDNNLLAIYENMDPRFKQTVSFHGTAFNPEYPMLDLTVSGAHAPVGDGCHGGYVHKGLPYGVYGNIRLMPNAIIFRVAEAWLNYAEALNEYNDTPPAAAYDALNIIRRRSGMPAVPENLTQLQFREKVRRERAVELAYEGHRLWDIRRWEIAGEGVMSGDMYGIRQYREGDEVRYEPYVFEKRSFKEAMYRHPFPQNEVNKGYLIQNPGY
jgi:hypothetical protein